MAENKAYKPMLDPSSENFGFLVNCAVRYTIGRETYAPGVVISFLLPLLPWLDDRTLRVLDQDISEARDGLMGQSLGDPKIDAPKWIELLHKVHAEQWRRELRGKNETEDL